MCGICGKIYFQENKQIDREMFFSMLNALSQRGPDEEGVFIERNMALGVKRLSIIDKDEGRQPFVNEDHTVRCVCNGEIYNYKELKSFLVKKNHRLISDNDCEIIVHLYEEFGISFLDKLSGMFALSLYDAKKRQLFVARDRIGIKPLYYAELPDSIIFSSSIESLLANPDITREISSSGLNHYFTFNFFPLEYTPFLSIKKLLPGHCMICNHQGVKVEKYWSLTYQIQRNHSEEYYLEKLHSLWEESIQTHLRSDVPVGIFLSGGVDSSTIACSVKKFTQDVNTFSIGFKENSFDERFYATSVAHFLKTRHQEISMPTDIGCLMERISANLDCPTGESSFVPTFVLSEFAREHVGVVLSGEGADELFGGYQTYTADFFARYIKRLPPVMKKNIFPFIVKILPKQDTRLNWRLKAELFLKGLNSGTRITHFFWREIFSEAQKQLLFTSGFLSDLLKQDSLSMPYTTFERYYSQYKDMRDLEKAMYFDLKVWLPEGILHRVDMASMAHSLEVRVPYLSDKLVEFSYTLPLELKIRRLRRKFILKKMVKSRLPANILSRPKQGFSVPINQWLKKDLKELMLENINNKSYIMDHVLNRQYVMSLFNEHIQGRYDHSRPLWNILMLVIWFNRSQNKK